MYTYVRYAEFKWETLLHVGPISVPAEGAVHFASDYYQMYDITISVVREKQVALYSILW